MCGYDGKTEYCLETYLLRVEARDDSWLGRSYYYIIILFLELLSTKDKKNL